MTAREMRSAVAKRMADGRIRTFNDIHVHIKGDPDRLASVLRSMVRKKELHSYKQSSDRDITIYRQWRETDG